MGALELRSFVVAVPSARPGAAVRRIAVSLAVRSGEIVAVVDPVDDPGAGPADSTALARAVAGLVEPVAGQVLVHGIDVTARALDDREIRYVPAGGGLLSHLTVEQNVRYGLDRSLVAREEAERRVRDAIERWDLPFMLDAVPQDLANEQRLQVAVARAAVCRPEALVADLPAAPTGSARLREIFQRTGVAVLLCSGNPAVVAAADRSVPANVVTASASPPTRQPSGGG
jgi:ABC-type Fe3+/spermidine/putrescine transport system ATPase subunit